VLQRLLKAGYPVLALAMPLLGDNSQPVVQLRRHGPVRLCDHDFLALVDHEFGRPSIRFFVEPVLAGINRLAAEGADRFAMLGWSGGGWTTTLCAALDPRIRASYSVAGSLPFSQRRRGEMSDYENHLPALYELANYPELYVLSASGPSRSAMQILNEYDTVAWSGRRGLAYERRVQDTLGRLGSGRFSCVIDDTWTGHGISRAALDRILSDLETRCENE
jgi:pimeloyl-ACP methyl ester carboxylesterase